MLIVEDGSGIVGAESYVTVAEADEYNLKMGNDSWPQPPSSASDDPNLTKKEAMLRRGAIFLDAKYGIMANGQKKNPDQGLVFPRVGATYLNGAPIEADTVPVIYKNAQMEVSNLAYSGVSLAVTIGAGEGDLIRKKIDVLEWQWAPGTQTDGAVFGWLDLMLASLFGEVDDDDPEAMQIGRVARA